jgi:hypothetical protein
MPYASCSSQSTFYLENRYSVQPLMRYVDARIQAAKYFEAFVQCDPKSIPHHVGAKGKF